MRSRTRQRPSEEAPWREAVLYRGLSDDALRALGRVMERRELPARADLAREGERATDLYWVEQGTIELFKKEPNRDVTHHIDTIGPGDCIGELALVDGLPRATSARARTASVVWALPFDRLTGDDVATDDRSGALLAQAREQIVGNLTRVLSARLRGKASESLEAARERAAMGQFIVNFIVLFVVYLVVASALPYVRDRLPSSTSYVSIPLQALFAWGSWKFMRGTGFPLSRFGLGLKHLLGSVVEAIVLTIPFLGLATAIKWGVMQTHPAWSAKRLVEHPEVMSRLSEPEVIKLLSIYVVSSAVQELIVRGAMQSSLQMFLGGRRRQAKAIAVSGLLFAAMHIHMSFLFAALALLPGLFWGWLYARRPNLVGVIVSHVVVGAYVFFILGASLP